MRRLAIALGLVLLIIGIGVTSVATPKNGILVIGTWNLGGYPETSPDRGTGFSNTLPTLGVDILCVQEIANQDRVNAFLHTESGFSAVAFQDSSDGIDNAIFFANGIAIEDLPDPMELCKPTSRPISLNVQPCSM